MSYGRIRHLHFMGAGGVGMCALAELLLAEGVTVSGCDAAASERTARLATAGARVWVGHDPAHLEGADALVVTAAVDAGHPELQAARERGLPVVKRAELLGEVMRRRVGIAVAGTHGKTTTSSLVGFLLAEAGLEPSILVGGRVHFLGGHARLGSGPYLVTEADEYDRAFLELYPAWAVITNVEPEHLECYGDRAGLEAAFVAFADRVPFYGAVIGCSDDPGVQRVLRQVRRRTLTVGLEEGAWLRATELAPAAGGTHFAVTAGGRRLGTVSLRMAGLHNVRNALAALAVGLELDQPFTDLAAALEAFDGVARRFQLRGQRDGVTVVDDYAHHPTEVRAVLAAARQAFPGRRLVAAFQPHLYSRTREFADGFGAALTGADAVLLLPIYPAREAPLPGVSSDLVAEAARRHGLGCLEQADGLADAVERLERLLRPGDVLLTLGAGNIDELAAHWLGEAP